MEYQKSLLTVLLAVALAAPSCIPKRQNLHYYVLVPKAEPKTALRVNLENVKLASFLDRHELTYLADTGELIRLPKAKWAQPLGTIIKEYLTAASRPNHEFSTDSPDVKSSLTFDQFFMTADGAFHVSGFSESRVGKDYHREAFAFDLPSQGPPSVSTIVSQTRAALELVVEKKYFLAK